MLFKKKKKRSKKELKKQLKQDMKDALLSFMSAFLAVSFFMVILGIVNKANLTETMYTMREYVAAEDKVADLIAERCKYEDTERNKVYCVYNIVTTFYRYNEHNDTKYYMPSDTLTSGGVCRDAALTYCVIFNKLGIECSYHTNDGHIFNIIDFEDDLYCVLDQNTLECV